MVFMMLCCSSFAMHWTSWKLVLFSALCNIVHYLNLTTGLVWVEATRALTTAINPLDKDAEKQNLSGVAPRYASNTLEQYLLSSGASLILSTHLSSENMHVIPVLVILFMFGRITFALGYKYYHAHRAFGHMITAFPTVCVYVYCVYRLVMNNFGYNRSRQVWFHPKCPFECSSVAVQSLYYPTQSAVQRVSLVSGWIVIHCKMWRRK